MGRAYSDITFTPGVREVQSRMGSREQYAFLDTTSERGDALTRREAQFIREADHFFQATISETGWPYVQHRGGPAGFLKVIDAKTIGFADYRGNLQYLSVGNLLKDDRISIIIVDYPNRRRLKLLGHVRLAEPGVDDAAIAAVRDAGYAATVERAFIITIEGWDWNCPQHITPRFTEAEVATLVKPLQEQIQRLRAQAPATKPVAASRGLGDGPLALKVAGVRQLTDAVRAYELVSADGTPLPAFSAGAHLDVPVRLPDGTASTRAYSIASSPLRTDAYEIAVLNEPDGKGGSLGVHRDLVLGLRLNTSMPGNDFPLEARAHRAVLVAGGIGITPIKAMAHALAARGDDFELHYATRSRAQAAYLGELTASFGERVKVHAKDEGQRLQVRELVAGLQPDEHLYVCGPSRLIDEVRSAAAAAGVAAQHIHFEKFTAETTRPGDHEFVVHLARSGKDLRVPPGQTILEVAEAQGLRLAASCRIGNCATCATRVLAGEPSHRDEVLTDEQKKDQALMCVCVSRAQGAEITLDA